VTQAFFDALVQMFEQALNIGGTNPPFVPTGEYPVGAGDNLAAAPPLQCKSSRLISPAHESARTDSARQAYKPSSGVLHGAR